MKSLVAYSLLLASILLLFVCLREGLYTSHDMPSVNGDQLRRRLGGIPTPVVDIGNDRILVYRSLFGAVILPRGKKMHDEMNHTLLLAGEPLVFRKWLPIETKPCPHYSPSSSAAAAAQASPHRSERGHGLSHMQVWLDFEFFDRDVQEARFRKVPEYVLSTTYSSVSGTFQAFPNGTLHKNGREYLDEDVLLVAEESLDSFKHVNGSRLVERLQGLKSGLAVIASCHRQNSLCLHAYAITRGACRVIAKEYDVCGAPAEHQLYNMWKRKLFNVSAV